MGEGGRDGDEERERELVKINRQQTRCKHRSGGES